MESFKLIELPYKADALQPVISETTIGFHHGKHLQTYVNNLNAALPGSGFEGKSQEDAAADAAPGGKLAAAIDSQLGSFDAFKQVFTQQGSTLFGSGWVWLSADADGKLIISQEVNAHNPVEKGLKPLLTFDVWEHAYYLDYQNRRPDHLAALWQIINWEVIEQRYV